jgi:hypothetical protein
MIDDEIKVIKSCLETDKIIPVWFEKTPEECLNLHSRIIAAPSWKSIRKFLARTKK